MRLSVLVNTLVVGWLFSQLSFGEEKKGMIPAHPKLLFEALPTKIDNWKMVESTGKTSLNVWLESSVKRKFVRIPSSDASKGQVTASAELSILDTAKHPQSNLQMFKNFEEFKMEGIQYLYIQGIPAIIQTGNSSMTANAQFLIKNRFIVTINLTNQPSKAVRFWYQLIKLGKLNAINDGKITPLPESFSAIEIDQMDPTKNAVFAVARGSSEVDLSSLSDEELANSILDESEIGGEEENERTERKRKRERDK